MSSLSLIAVLSASGFVWAQSPESRCAGCHVKEAATQPATPMGMALLVPGKTPAFKPQGRLSFQRDGFTWSVQTHGNASTYSVTDGARTVTLPIQWTFGAGAQTFLFSRNDAYLESMVSYYDETRALDITVGSDKLHPTTVEEAIGRPISIREVTLCFSCHSTRAVTGQTLHLSSLVPGVQCERCHTDAAAHASAFSTKSLPEKLGSRSAESISNFCGQCHRTWENVVRLNLHGQSNVRFQPYRLANSKCFDGADARISCIACHNPHQDVVRDDAKYDAKCLACHASGDSRHAAAAPSQAPACPVAKTSCVTCHMPKVQLPGGHQTFRDHDIRVVHRDEKYPD